MFFNDCKVPVENLLSERQNGFKIAVNILNIGRIKLAGAGAGRGGAGVGSGSAGADEMDTAEAPALTPAGRDAWAG